MKRSLIAIGMLAAISSTAIAGDLDDLQGLILKIPSKMRILDILKQLKVTTEASWKEAEPLLVDGGGSLGESYNYFLTPGYKETKGVKLIWPTEIHSTDSNYVVDAILIATDGEERIFVFDGKQYKLMAKPAPSPKVEID